MIEETLLDELEYATNVEARVIEVRAWLAANREDFKARAERARLNWPKDFDGSVLCGPVDEGGTDVLQSGE